MPEQKKIHTVRLTGLKFEITLHIIKCQCEEVSTKLGKLREMRDNIENMNYNIKDYKINLNSVLW